MKSRLSKHFVDVRQNADAFGLQSVSSQKFKLKVIASAVGVALGFSLFATLPAYAAEAVAVEDLQKENERLRKEIEALKQGLKIQPALAEQPLEEKEAATESKTAEVEPAS